MNTDTKKYLITFGALAAVAAILIGGWLGYNMWQSKGVVQEGTTSVGFTVYEDKQPSLDRELVFPESFPGDAKKIVTDQIETLRSNIKVNPADYASWLDLAIQYKIINDYEGARDIWEYLNIAAPKQSVSFQNLGNLYDLYLKDYSKAEENYLTAIKNTPDISGAYLGLADLYRYSYKKDTSAAVDILKKGIDAIPSPQNTDMVIYLASYYKEKGDNANAIKYYEQVRELAKDLLNVDLENQMTTEINALK